MNETEVIATTSQWLERAVIGLNLCPFAKVAYVKQRVRFTVSAATSDEALLDDLIRAGVKLWTQDGRLFVNVEGSVLTDDLRARIKARREDLIMVSLTGTRPSQRASTPRRSPPQGAAVSDACRAAAIQHQTAVRARRRPPHARTAGATPRPTPHG